MQYNYHTHCNITDHATGTIEEYVKKAIKYKYKVIGFSEHMPSPLSRNNRISMEDYYLKYLPEIERCRKLYGDKIRILCGLEVEYEPRFKAFHKMLLNNVDYLILGEHEFLLNGDMASAYAPLGETFLKTYVKYINEALKTGDYQILAHPDVFRMGYGVIFDEMAKNYSTLIIDAAINNNVLLEINANGVRKRAYGRGKYFYPCKEFFELAKSMGAKFIIGDDSHAVGEFADKHTNRCKKFAAGLGIKLDDMIEIKTNKNKNKY